MIFEPCVGEVVIHPTPYGWIFKDGTLIFVISMFLCLGIIWNNHIDIHELKNALVDHSQGITIAVSPGVIGVHIDTSEQNNCYQVTSDSTVPVRADVTEQNGNILFTYENLLPGGSFLFKTVEPRVVVVSAL